jgi:hypothetical protein
MKTLLATAAVLATLTAANAAGDVGNPDQGAAAIVVYGGLCNPNDIPEHVQDTIAIYNKARRDQVMAEMKTVFKIIYSTNTDLDSKTAENAWCSFMRPKILRMR